MNRKWHIAFCLLFVQMAFALPKSQEQAFPLAVDVSNPNQLTLTWDLPETYFIYKDKIHFSFEHSSISSIGKVFLPKSQQVMMSSEGSYEVYAGKVVINVSVLGLHPGENVFKIVYQGCSEGGFCYPPITKRYLIRFNKQLAMTQAEAMKQLSSESEEGVPDTSVVDDLLGGHWFWWITGFYVMGLLLSMTPCMWPMFPVLLGIIVGHQKSSATHSPFSLSLTYVLGMSITYAIMGIVVAHMGSYVQAAFQHPAALTIMSLFFVVMALSAFGIFKVSLPAKFELMVANVSRHQRAGTFIGVGLMGALATVILSPCVTPPLMGVLAYVAQTGHWVMGAMSLFVLSLGMGTPLLVVGSGAMKLPKAGHWMVTVNHFIGFVLLGVAIHLLGRFLPESIELLFWASLIIAVGFFWWRSHRFFFKVLGGFALLYGILVLQSGLRGGTQLWPPLVLVQSQIIKESHLGYEKITSLSAYQDLLKRAAQEQKPILLELTAKWCSTCKENKKTILADEQLVKQLNDILLAQIDMTSDNPQLKALRGQLNLMAPPTYVFVHSDGDELTSSRIIGKVSTSLMKKRLGQLR